MSKKLYAALLPLLAVIAFGTMTAVAQAEPHWYKCEAKAGGAYHDPDCTEKTGTTWELTRLPFTSEKFQVSSYGILTLKNATLGEVTCKNLDAGNIWNVNLATPGKDEITVFVLYACKAATCTTGLEVTAEGLPWPTELIEVAGVIRVKIGTAAAPVKIRVKCTTPAVNTVFEGELTPKWVNNSPSYVEFGEGSGHLTSSLVGEGTVTGKEFISGTEKAENILVKNP
ncbi:MAG: hypothetical protein ACLQQB_10975 [Solirubrobacteraceae bacterium]